jgi:hypothetical protein
MNDNQERYSDPAEIRHKIGTNGQLTINNVSGGVQLRPNDGEEVVVSVHSESGRSEWLPLTVRKSEGALTIDVEKRGSFAMFGTFFGSNDGMEFDVSVPRAAWVQVNSVSADINAHFLSGEQSYKTVSGDIDIDPDGGRIKAVTVSGDVQVRAAEPIELSVHTTSGDMNIQGALINRLDVRTVSGDIELEAGFAVGPLHTIESVSGDLSIESSTGVTVDVKSSMDLRRGGSRGYVAGDGAAQVRFRTLSGDCHVSDSHEIGEDGREKRGKRGGRRHERFERELERRIERQARRGHAMGPDDINFPGMPEMPPMPPMPPVPPVSFGPPSSPPPKWGTDARVPSEPQPVDQLEVLRALERGEIDVEEASRRLQEA